MSGKDTKGKLSKKFNKYELVKEDTSFDFQHGKLYRIRALRDIRTNVKAGDLGGYISNENNLSQQGECWVDQTSVVAGDAKVIDDAYISQMSDISGEIVVSDQSGVSGPVRLTGQFKIHNQSRVSSESRNNAVVGPQATRP